MLRYLETFYRHRLLLISPLILALTASIGFVLVQPRTYEATANIRFYQPASDAATSSNAGYLSAADQGAAQLRELLRTRSFSGKVGRLGPLANYVAAEHPSASNNADILDDLLVDTLNKKTVISANGPEIVNINFDYQNPDVASTTLSVMLDELQTELLGNRRDRAQTAIDFYKKQVDIQAVALADADAKVLGYLQAHPAQRVPGAIEDVQLTSLRQTDDLARERYRDLLLKYDQAQVELAAISQQGSSGFRVIDAPTVPYRSKGFLKSVLLAAAGGLLAGFALLLIGLMALTSTDTSANRAQDIEEQLGRRVVGTIPRLR